MHILKYEQLNEGTNNNEFKTDLDVSNVDFITNIDKKLYDYFDVSSCIVYWTYDMEVKNYSIKSIIPTIIRIVLDINYDMCIKGSDETESEIISYEIDGSDDIEIEYINDLPTIPYHPMEVEVNAKTKKTIVKF